MAYINQVLWAVRFVDGKGHKRKRPRPCFPSNMLVSVGLTWARCVLFVPVSAAAHNMQLLCILAAPHDNVEHAADVDQVAATAVFLSHLLRLVVGQLWPIDSDDVRCMSGDCLTSALAISGIHNALSQARRCSWYPIGEGLGVRRSRGLHRSTKPARPALWSPCQCPRPS